MEWINHQVLGTVRCFSRNHFSSVLLSTLKCVSQPTMEFWGVEVKSGESLKVDPGDDTIVHLSMACMGEVNKDKGSEPVSLYVKFGDQKLVLGTLSFDKFPQISYDLIFEKEFELSHSWKNGSVFFTGYKAEAQVGSDNDEDTGDFHKYIQVSAANGNSEIEVKNSVKADANEAKQKEKIGDQRKNEKANEKDANGEDEEDSSESEADEDSSEDEPMVNGEIESSEDDDSDDDDDDDDDESDDQETPNKTEPSNKRALESSKKTLLPEKKAKLVTPQKTGGKSGGHVATPYPSKQAGKAAANNSQPVKQQTPKSGGDYSCKPCNRSFKTEDALNSHNRAKHSAK